MEKVKEKLAQLKAEIDSANGRYEASESKLNELKLQYKSKEAEAKTYVQKIAVLEDQISQAENQFEKLRTNQVLGDSIRGQTESLQKKVNLLENTLAQVLAKVSEAQEKLRELETRADQSQQQAEQLESGRAELEERNAEILQKYSTTKRELDETLKGLECL